MWPGVRNAESGERPRTMSKLDVMMSSEDQMWQTPRLVLDPVDIVMGRHPPPVERSADDPVIDLDPCGGAGDVVGASRSLTEEDDGLVTPWPVYGRGTRVFCNSEYGTALQLWTSRARYFGAGANAGGVGSCVVIGLWPSRTDTVWYGRDIVTADVLCHWSGRIPFKGAPAGAPFPSVLPYWGPLPMEFADVFLDYGTITITRGSNAGLYQRRRVRKYLALASGDEPIPAAP